MYTAITVNDNRKMWLIYAILVCLRSTDNAITVILLEYIASLLYQVIVNMLLLLYCMRSSIEMNVARK